VGHTGAERFDLGDAPIVKAELDRFRDNTAGRVSPAWGTAHIRKALVELGEPQNHMPPVIHITGTNGKGSTGAFIRAIAEAASMRVHVFTSPHLQRVNERIRVASKLVDDDDLADVLADIWRRTEALTYFEALTAAAFCLFAQERADLCVIEVGAGGATDATNVMSRPAACVVTPISRDHESMFGVSGVAAIARLKAGIFREGAPAIIAEQPAIPLGVLREEARTAGAPVAYAGEDWEARWDGEAFVYSGGRGTVRAPWLGLPGRHQAQNAGAACAAIDVLKDTRLTPAVMAAGLRECMWPGRLQRLKPGPLAGTSALWIDAAHNPGGAATLARAIGAGREEGERVAMVIAIQAVKDVSALLTELKPEVDLFVACPLPDSGGQEGGPGADPHDLAALISTLGGRAKVAVDLEQAVAIAREEAERVYIAGSVYLCGAALSLNGEQVE
jgi:dihydrofolate synthase / folylpolyglutamate synthase